MQDLPKAKIKRVNLPRRQAEKGGEGGRERFVKYHGFCIYECRLCHRHNVRVEAVEECKYFLPFKLARCEVLPALCHELQLNSMECGA